MRQEVVACDAETGALMSVEADLGMAHGQRVVESKAYRPPAALIDLVLRGDREGARFYKVLRWGWHSEKVIGVYSAIEHEEPGAFTISRDYTVDGVIARLENVVAREVEKGGTAASIKSAMDRTIDQIHAGTGGARDAVVRTADEVRKKFEGRGSRWDGE